MTHAAPGGSILREGRWEVNSMFSDNAVAMKLKTELRVRDVPETVRVEVSDGAAVVKGRVESESKAREIERICWTVEGVTRVENRLKAS